MLLLVAVAGSSSPAVAEDPANSLADAQWIWIPGKDTGNAEAGSVYFRKEFEVKRLESAKIQITCDNEYELFVNGTKVGADSDWMNIETYDIAKLIAAGKNVVAIHAKNEAQGHAGLVAALTVERGKGKQGKGKQGVHVVTDKSWLASKVAADKWQSPGFQIKPDDKSWQPANELGQFGKTGPWSSHPEMRTKVQIAQDNPGIENGRFSALPGFAVEKILGTEAGSLIAMAFDESGDLLVSAEQEPLKLVRLPRGNNGSHSQGAPMVSTFSEKITSSQGILCYRGSVFVVGKGPDGAALYRLTDGDRNGHADKIETLFKFQGDISEHGPHQPVVGPDGLIYVMVGNHAKYPGKVEETSPHHHYYDTDLFQPKYEDANGHAGGIKAPGGTVIRTDSDGRKVELFCGGFRNAYDIAFNALGDLFTYDSDMEWDIGLPWYRPVRVNHLVPGGEYGWRSGMSKWPDYYVDSLGSTVDLGRGSPTGVLFYHHELYPAEYRDNMFLCDWSQGYLIGVRHKPDGASYKGQSYNFLEGRPLNISDAEVGPDGNIYFCTGGRGTAGGIYRIVMQNPPALPVRSGIERALLQPQKDSAWARAAIESVKQELGPRWEQELHEVLKSTDSTPQRRNEALRLLQQYGPAPSVAMLIAASKDADSMVRGTATYLLGLHSDPAVGARLQELLDDPDARVRRLAAESVVRGGYRPPVEKLVRLLGDPDRFVAWSAQRAIQQYPVDQWKSAVLNSKSLGAFLQGGTALMIISAKPESASEVIAAAQNWLGTKLSDGETLQMYRLLQLALSRGKLSPKSQPELLKSLASRFPENNGSAARELSVLLVYLQDPTLAPKLIAALSSDKFSDLDKRQLAFNGRFLTVGWTPDLRDQLLAYLRSMEHIEGQGNSFKGYFNNSARDFVRSLSIPEQLERIATGANSPAHTIPLVQGFSGPLNAEQYAALRTLYESIHNSKDGDMQRLTREVLAAFGRSNNEEAWSYLHKLFENEPERRQDVALGIANHLDRTIRRHDADRKLLVLSLPVVDGETGRRTVIALRKFNSKDATPLSIRQTILLGLKLKNNGGIETSDLLEHWTSAGVHKHDEKSGEKLMEAWRQWYIKKYPDQPEPSLPKDSDQSKWTFAQLMKHLESEAGAKGDATRGEAIFTKADCIKCHRFGNKGEGIGPDLTNVAKRFQRKEIIESVLFPSQVISDQFAAKTVVTQNGQSITGLVAVAANGDLTVLNTQGEKIAIPKAEVDEVTPSTTSAMPEGLFNKLTLDEIVDLLAYLAKPPQ